MPITGLDHLSQSILESLDKGKKLKYIPLMFPVSLDQAKRLSRYRNFLIKATKNLTAVDVKKIRSIGIKALYLSTLFQEEDWEGLTEILSSIDENTKRDEFPLLIKALQENRQRISDFQQDIDSKLSHLKQREQELHNLDADMKVIQERIKKESAFLSKYPEPVQMFLVKHLGIYQEKLVLARRLDSLWQKSLKKKNILEYDGWNYVWYVRDLDQMAADYLKRTNRKIPLSTEWDYDKEEHRNRNADYYPPENPVYRLPQGLAATLQSSIEDIEGKMKSIEDERKTIRKEMKELKSTSIQSFIESIEASNYLSVHDLKLHGEMQNKALKWLYNKGYIVASEVILPNAKRADVVGYNEEGHVIIIEVKVSAADFRRDEKWKSYLDYCDEFYFLPNLEAEAVYYQKKYKGVGLLQEKRNNINIVEAHTLKHKAKERKQLHFLINKVLTRKYVYGF